MSREIKPIPAMAQAIVAEREANGYKKKVYKAEADAHKGEALQQDILAQLGALQATEQRRKVDLRNIEDVKQRTYDYLAACAEAEAFPSVMGLAVHGYGISRQALNQFLQRNRNEVTEFIDRTKDVIADILTNASLYNNANAVAVIFQLKNSHSFADRVEIEPVMTQEDTNRISIGEIEAKYAELPEF